MEFTGLRLNVREMPSVAALANGRSLREFMITVAGNSVKLDAQNGNAVDMSSVAVAIDPSGKGEGYATAEVRTKIEAAQAEKVRQAGLSARQRLELGPGRYLLRFAVRDNLSGEIGSLEYPLEID